MRRVSRKLHRKFPKILSSPLIFLFIILHVLQSHKKLSLKSLLQESSTFISLEPNLQFVAIFTLTTSSSLKPQPSSPPSSLIFKYNNFMNPQCCVFFNII
ncbi:hypothetical protein RYX36_019382 [Vicia faba]